MEADAAARDAAWMVPLLVFVVTVLGGAAVGLIVWVVNRAIAIAMQFRVDVLARLEQQDNEQAAQRSILSEIKDLLRDEVNKIRQQLSSQGHRISRLEEHNGIHQRRYDDQESGD